MKKRSVIMLLLVIPILYFSLLQNKSKTTTEESSEIGSIPSFTDNEIKNPEIALEHGILGYIEISTIHATKELSVSPNVEFMLNLNITFVSYDKKIKETEITINPDDPDGLIIERSLGDGKGIVRINDYIEYSIMGKKTLEAGKSYYVTMTIKLPTTLSGATFYLGAIGISSEYPIIDYVGVKIFV